MCYMVMMLAKDQSRNIFIKIICCELNRIKDGKIKAFCTHYWEQGLGREQASEELSSMLLLFCRQISVCSAALQTELG